jgi:imidazolonepropionase-like amidohydrolase
MPVRSLAAATAALLASSALAQTPVADLAKPPAGATHFVIESTGGKHGDSWLWTAPDGTRMSRETWGLRGQVWDGDSASKAGPDGMPVSIVLRGVRPEGDAGETFRVADHVATWQSPVDKGSAPYTTPVFYNAFGGTIDFNAWFLETLLKQPDKSLRMLPGGAAHAEKLTTVDVGSGATRQTVTLWSITGINNTPVPVWADAHDRFFAATSTIGWLPEAYAGEQQKLEAAQQAALASYGPKNYRTLVKMPAGATAFTHVRLFDSIGRRFLDDQTVVVTGATIAAVGPARSIKVPAGAVTFDGHGKTLLPGLWDCHMHVGGDFTGVQELSMGVTSVRDPGNNDRLTIDRRTRAAAGQLLMPHVYPSSLIDGKGPYTAQVANVATSQDEAIKLVDAAKAKNFTGVKFYGTFDPDWLPATITEAHRLGLHVHGHIPHGIRTSQAIADGYDEVTHINWIMMEAMPASVLPTDNGIGRFEAPGRYAKDVDLNGAPLTGLVATMATKHIYSDPTMVAFESLYVPDNGELSPSYAAFTGTLPPSVERGFRNGGFAVPKDLTRADYRASWAKMVGLLAKMHKAGVPIVAGTDGSGIELIRELEIYESAGFTPGEAIAAATIVPAQLVGQGDHTGSVTVGKAADLTLVEGDPSKDIDALRQTRTVMIDGKLLDADALRSAAGFSGRPH